MHQTYALLGLVLGALSAGCPEPSAPPPNQPRTGEPAPAQVEPTFASDASAHPVGPEAGPRDRTRDAAADAQPAPEASAKYAPTGEPDVAGPYTFSTYDADVVVPLGRVKLTVYYPGRTRAAETFPLIPIAPGASFTKESMVWIASHLATHGYVAVTITPTFLYGVDVTPWGEAVLDALKHARTADTDPGSPLYGLLDDDNVGVLGYSAGGGGAFVSATRDGAIDTVVGLAPAVNLLGAPRRVEVPFLEICGDLDDLVPSDACNDFYDRQDPRLGRQVMFVKGSGHWVNTDGATADNTAAHQQIAKRFLTAWFHAVLKGLNDHYKTYFRGALADRDVSEGRVTSLRFVAL